MKMHSWESFPVVFRNEKVTPGSHLELPPASLLWFCGCFTGRRFLPKPCHHSPRNLRALSDGVWRAALGPPRQQVTRCGRGRASRHAAAGPAARLTLRNEFCTCKLLGGRAQLRSSGLSGEKALPLNGRFGKKSAIGSRQMIIDAK